MRPIARSFSSAVSLALLAAGCIATPQPDAEEVAATSLTLSAATRQFASHYLKNFPATNSNTQWSHVIISNPNPTSTTVTLTVRAPDGHPLGTVTKTIAARGRYNSFCDPAWLNVPESDAVNHRSSGWVELNATAPVVATNQVALRAGTTCDAPVDHLDYEPFVKDLSTTLRAGLFVKNWGTGIPGVTQWSNLTVNNPGTTAANLTIRVYGQSGTLLKTLYAAVPAGGSWGSYGNAEWNAVPDTSPPGSLGWAEVTSDAPVVGWNRIAFRAGTAYNSPLTELDETALSTSTAYNLRASLFVKGWNASATMRQWSSFILTNPGASPANVTARVYGINGGLLGTVVKTIPARGFWISFQDDPGWTQIANSDGDRSLGWVDISSDRPITGWNRIIFRDGSSPNGTPKLFNDEPLAQSTSSKVFGWAYLQRWPTAGGKTLYTGGVIDNPNAYPVTITVRILKKDGSGDVTYFTANIPAHGAWIAAQDPRYTNAPDTDVVNQRSEGWVEITASDSVFGSQRVSIRDGDTPGAPVLLFDDLPFDGRVDSGCDPLGPGVFCPQSAAPQIDPFKELVIVDPSVTGDAVRASNAQDGHFSFRWLMEQMASPGADPADFVQSFFTEGFKGGTVNGFTVSNRAGVSGFLASWPRRPDGKLDLAQAPFRLLAIVNRADVTVCPDPSSYPGEARFVFGLEEGGSPGPMTVIFEYKLPKSASRALWAQRFHALGAGSFGQDYNAQLQMLTDEIASRGSDPSGVSDSSLGQVRTNEIRFGSPWELREFNLASVGGLAALRLTTTKQTPDATFSMATINSFVASNHDAVLAGTACFPSSWFGGESFENASSSWSVATDEPTRSAFGKQTCNGCHNFEVPVRNGFYHVSPTSPGGADGKGRLSPFVVNTEVPRRQEVLQNTLCGGSCAGSKAATSASTVRVH